MNLKIDKQYLCSLVGILILAVLFKFLPYIALHYGVGQLNKKQYVKAYKALDFAYMLNSYDKDIRYNYTLSLTKLSPTIKVQKAIYKMSESRFDDSAKNLARQNIQKFKNKFLINYIDNYIVQASNDSRIIRWDDSTFPLKVFIDDIGVSVPDYYNIAIFRALRVWEDAVDFLGFKKVDSPSDANIVITMDNLPKDVCDGNYCKFVVGYTEPRIENGILKKMDITLYDKDPRGKYFSDQEIFNTILHEMGHALGIMGHSFNDNDIMHMSSESDDFDIQKSSFQYLTYADRSTIKLLYRLLPDISNVNISEINTKGLVYAPIILGNSDAAISKKMDEARNYIRNAPELPSGYIDLASAYTSRGDINLAVKTLQKGLKYIKRKQDKFLLYYNLSVIYINGHDYENAQKYLDKAKEIKSNADTEKLQRLIYR